MHRAAEKTHSRKLRGKKDVSRKRPSLLKKSVLGRLTVPNRPKPIPKRLQNTHKGGSRSLNRTHKRARRSFSTRWTVFETEKKGTSLLKNTLVGRQVRLARCFFRVRLIS